MIFLLAALIASPPVMTPASRGSQGESKTGGKKASVKVLCDVSMWCTKRREKETKEEQGKVDRENKDKGRKMKVRKKRQTGGGASSALCDVCGVQSERRTKRRKKGKMEEKKIRIKEER